MTGLHTVSAVGSCRRANLPNWRRRFGIDSTSLQTAPPHKSACALCVLSLDGVRWRVLLCFALRESHHDVRAHHVHTQTHDDHTQITHSTSPLPGHSTCAYTAGSLSQYHDVGTGTHPCISAGRCSVAGRQHTALPLPSPRKNRVFAAPDCRAVPKEPHMPICNGRVHPL